MISRERARAEATPPVIDTLPTFKVHADPRSGARTARAALLTHWPRVGLVVILALSSALNIIGLGGEGYANTYYAAAVKSMLTGWHNFFFASFDAGGFVTVDKPPLGLWIQTISARLFGFSNWSILLPQALAGVASVGLLYWLVRRVWGPVAGLVAALALAVTPISVVTSRNNTSDTVLVLALLGAVWAVSVASERGSLRHLLLGGVMVGLAFNIKMLEAYIVFPALALAYLLGAPRSWRARFGHVALLGLVTLVVSFAWVAVVDLTPASARPYVGSSGTNSALSLVLGYNGLTRLTTALPAGLRQLATFLPGDVDLDVAPGMSPGIGDPGLLRLLNSGLAGQASWLLALAVIGVVAAGFSVRRWLPLDRRGQSLVLWGGWLLGAGGFFSVARFFHIYYLTLLGPAVAALAGLGVGALWRAWRQGQWLGWFLPPALVGAAFVQRHILASYPVWSQRLATPIVVACLGAAVLLLLVRLRPRWAHYAAPALAATAILALLVSPTVWSVVSVQAGNGAAWLPEAGPASTMGFGGGGRNAGGQAPQGGFQTGGMPQAGAMPQTGNQRTAPAQGQGAPATRGNSQGGQTGAARQPGAGGAGGGGGQALTVAGANWDVLNPQLVQYLLANQGNAEFLVATPTSTYASVFMLATDQPAMALGGYQGWDRILTPTELAALVREGTVRFFLLNSSGSRSFANGTGGQDATADLTAWVQTSCTVVSATTWQTTSGSGTSAASGQQLYDCAAVVSAQP